MSKFEDEMREYADGLKPAAPPQEKEPLLEPGGAELLAELQRGYVKKAMAEAGMLVVDESAEINESKDAAVASEQTPVTHHEPVV